MEFLTDNILLTSSLAMQLYKDYAKSMPIIDYHCHIDQQLILEDKKFNDITELWLSGDHYKWRLMRNCGVEEKFITGNASAREKFRAFAACMPQCIGNPIYIWCHLELKTYFNITLDISPQTADEIFDRTKKLLSGDNFSAQNIVRKSNVEAICTTDDPIDNLSVHKKLATQDLGFKVLPTFRPDKALNIELPGFCDYIKALEGASGIDISGIQSLKDALRTRLNFFIENGCRISDHALGGFTYAECSEAEADAIFTAALGGEGKMRANDAEKYRTFVLLYLAKLYHDNDMVMQLHFNCLRNNNSKMHSLLGPDTGFDCINSSAAPHKLVKFFDSLHTENSLPKTIVYSLDPQDDKLINTIINCFQGGGKGKMQHGSAWWFNDTEYGMRAHIKTLAEYSVLGNFVGMLTDSRSFTSYVRHDYFRRILCDYVANQVNAGKYPSGQGQLQKLIQDICYNNIKNYLF